MCVGYLQHRLLDEILLNTIGVQAIVIILGLIFQGYQMLVDKSCLTLFWLINHSLNILAKLIQPNFLYTMCF